MLFRMFDLTSGNLSPVVNFEGISKNVMTVGFQVLPIIDTNWWNTISNKQAEGRWMFTGGEDCTARIWDLKMRNLSCQVYSPMDRKETSTFLFLANLPSQRTSDLRLPPPQPAGDGRRGPVRSNSHLEFTGQTLLLSYAGDIS